MPDKKINPADDAAESPLEQYVDQIMDKRLPDESSTAPPLADDTLSEQLNPTDNLGSSPVAAATTDPSLNTPPTTKTDPQLTKDGPVDGEDDPLVDEIASHDGDEILAAHDAAAAKLVTKKPSFKERLRSLYDTWWQNKYARYGTFAGLAVVLLAITLIPNSRYFVLNTVGVRAAASVVIKDRTTQLPLKNVAVAIGGQTAQTNKDGAVKLKDLKLGTQQMRVEQLGFAEVTRTVTLGLGSNPLGEIQLKAVGLQYQFKLVDFLSGKPVKKAEASSGDANAQSDDKGVVVLTIGKVDGPNIDVNIAASGYRTEKLTLDPTSKQMNDVTMVAGRKALFVSKQSGKYDVYKMDIDGKNKELLLAGSGLETPQMTLVQHTAEEQAALVSSRENKRNQDGYLLQNLTLINVEDGTTLDLDSSERIQIVDWVKDTLVYVKIKAGTSAGNPERYQLMSYDYNTTARLQLATANYFSDVISAKGVIYYASSNFYKDGQDQFVSVNPDNSGKQVLHTSQIWNIVRGGYDELKLYGPDTWYNYKLGDKSPTKLSAAPAGVNETRFYLDAPDGKHALWTEERDGKGVLLSYEAATKKDTTLVTQSGLNYPLRWLNSRTVIYRVVTPQQTADYVVSLDGGTARKVSDVTNVSGLGRWYYY